MSIAVRGTPFSADTTGTTDPSLTLPVSIAQDDVVVVAAGNASNADANGAMVTSGYTEEADLFGSDSQSCNLSVFWKRMGATPDSTAVFDNTSSVGAGAVGIAFSGVDTTTALDATTTTATASNSGTPDPPSITTNTANAWVIAVGGSSEADDVTNAPTNYSNLIDTRGGGGTTDNWMMATREIASAGAENPGTFADVVGSATDAWAAATLALKPTSGTTIAPAKVSFALTGKTVLQNVAVSVTKVSFTLSGKALTLGNSFVVDRAQFSLTGKPVLEAVALTVSKASLGFTGRAVNLTNDTILSVGAAAFTLTGRSAQASVALSVAKAALALTGQAVNSPVALPIGKGAFGFTGRSVTLDTGGGGGPPEIWDYQIIWRRRRR